MANVATHPQTAPTAPAALTAAEIAALALSLAHLGTGPQATTARRALHTLLDATPTTTWSPPRSPPSPRPWTLPPPTAPA
ncbi:hypothetical protein LUW76_39620 [Actinomadura madurae]|uniref:hypothetical protein n=1 Tax=Actinomadura madurae TaxID=1993 RepID=UPI0020270820|nr:hypothetical protein [Actinomadura madurae]URM99938.1 hypothetical protein LUW76_39620 [Actinomadura madurae]